MTDAFRCPECGSRNHVFAAFSESLLAISGDLSTEAVLQRILDVARRLVHASYGGIGVRDDDGNFARFVASGSGAAERLAPQTAAALAPLVEGGRPYVTSDVGRDERFAGWPPEHPELRSLMGVPITVGGDVVGAFFVGNENAWGFTGDQVELVRLLATHVALAIRNARLYEQSRELSVVQERNRLARELHDSVTQTLFSMKLAAETANALVSERPDDARAELGRLQELARQASAEMRSLIFELRPAEVETDGLVATLRKHVDVVRRVHGIDVELLEDGDGDADPAHERDVFRVVQEAMNNAIRHAHASRIVVELTLDDDKVRASVSDDGDGFDVASSSGPRRLGLVSMRERAEAIGGDLVISSAPGSGTVVSLEVRR